MQRAFLSLFIMALTAFPALAGPRPTVNGDPAIDAQWIWQLRKAPAVCGTCTPIDQTGRVRLRRVAVPQLRRAHPVVAIPDLRRAAPTVVAPQRMVDPAYLPAVVNFKTSHRPGTIVIDTGARYLYLVMEGGKAQRYGVGVGRDGFGWSGAVKVGRKAEWPTWTPPAAMRKRQPHLPVSMKGGKNNPLGARAIYLYRGGNDTLFRIHGSNEPWTIGQRVSSGCFRMRNEDVVELYGRVRIGTQVVVL